MPARSGVAWMALVATRGLQAGRVELALEAVWIEADSVRVTQIVENLLGNALKHTPADKRIRVTVQRYRRGRRVAGRG